MGFVLPEHEPAEPATLVTTVDFADPWTLVWNFDHPVFADGAAEPSLEAQGPMGVYQGPDTTVQTDLAQVTCTYDQPVDPEALWRILVLPTHVIGIPPIAVPQNGQVVGLL